MTLVTHHYEDESTYRARIDGEIAQLKSIVLATLENVEQQGRFINVLKDSIDQLRSDNHRLLDLIEQIVGLDRTRAEAFHTLSHEVAVVRNVVENLQQRSMS